MKREELGTWLTEPNPNKLVSNKWVYDKTEADSVMDALEERIKELELALENSREHEKALRKCFEGHRKQIKELQEEINVANQCTQEKLQRIKELEADKLRQENYCESLVNENKRLNEIIISKDMVGAELANENKDLRHNLEDYKCENEALKARINELEDELQVANRCAEDARERIKELEANQPKWISVDERLPKEDDEILFTDGEFIYKGCWTTWDGGCSDFSYVVDSGFVDEVNDESFTEEQITHWMPLPSAPKSED